MPARSCTVSTIGPRPLIWCSRHRALLPRRGWPRAAVIDQHQPLAFAVFKRQRQPAVNFGNLAQLTARLLQAIAPITETFFAGDAQPGAGNAVGSTPLRRCRKVEEGEIGAGIGVSVGVEQMVGADVVLIDGLLDQPHPEQAGIKRQVLARFRGNRRQMMDPGQLHQIIL